MLGIKIQLRSHKRCFSTYFFILYYCLDVSLANINDGMNLKGQI